MNSSMGDVQTDFVEIGGNSERAKTMGNVRLSYSMGEESSGGCHVSRKRKEELSVVHTDEHKSFEENRHAVLVHRP